MSTKATEEQIKETWTRVRPLAMEHFRKDSRYVALLLEDFPANHFEVEPYPKPIEYECLHFVHMVGSTSMLRALLDGGPITYRVMCNEVIVEEGTF